jgi:hypothetical protein
MLSNVLDVDGGSSGSYSPVVGISPAIDIDGGGGGGGSDLPVVGISPAKIEVERAHISATAIANRFMGFSSLRR